MASRAGAARIARLGLLAALAVAGPGVAAPLDEAAQALTAGNAAAALSTLNTWLDTHPDDDRARYLKASALAGTGHDDDALNLLQALARRYPQRPDVWNNLAIVEARTGRLVDARKTLEHAVQIAPQDAALQQNLGDLYLALANAAYDRAGQMARSRREQLGVLLPALQDLGAEPAQPAHSSPASARESAQGAPDRQDTQDTAEKTAIRQVLMRRARARREDNFDAWLSTYSDNYVPPGGQSRSDWLRQARRQFSQSVVPDTDAIDTLVVEQATPDSARVRLSREDNDTRSSKHAEPETIDLVREDGDWRIAAEN